MALAEPKLVAGAQILAYIAAEFEWKLTSLESLDTVADLSKTKYPKGTLLGQFNIELTLTRRIHPGYTQLLPGLNERFLTDAAFLPKNYTNSSGARPVHGSRLPTRYRFREGFAGLFLPASSERISSGFRQVTLSPAGGVDGRRQRSSGGMQIL
ncbi:hypothetical protein B0O99DRAFT_682234 [Bisporella sp. PMI_857]|nr:hypothetical protein B0O99DRAFT_682756 [Bisporella sp. PMI_857]KAH8600544.1 hypothetical protein B0O99DRAFT_682234 [Bisporella sp. PMI_857]